MFRVSGSFAALRMTARTNNGNDNYNRNCNCNGNRNGNCNRNDTPPFALQGMGHPEFGPELKFDFGGVHGGGWVGEFQALEGVYQDLGDGYVAIPLVVGGDNEPEGVFFAGR